MTISADQIRTLRDQTVAILSQPAEVNAALNALEQAGTTSGFIYNALIDLRTLYTRHQTVQTSLTPIANQVEQDAATIAALQAQDANQNQIKVDQVIAFLNGVMADLNQIDGQATNAIQTVVQDIANAIASVE